MIKKIEWSIGIILFWILSMNLWSVFQGSVESSVAVNQLADSKVVYGASQSVAHGLIGTLINIVFVVVLLIVWLKKEKVNASK